MTAIPLSYSDLTTLKLVRLESDFWDSGVHPFTYKLFQPEFTPKAVGRVLDVGCGKGLIGFLMRMYRNPVCVDGIDASEPYLAFAEDLNVYDSLTPYNFESGRLPFDTMSYDTVFCIEVIEHLHKPQALRLVRELERIGRSVILSTTRDTRPRNIDVNHLQKHRCDIHPRYFLRRGYHVEGAGPIHIIRNGTPYRMPFGDLMPKITGYVPSLAKQYVAARHGGNP